MLGSKNRDFKTEQRAIGRRLKVHKLMMEDGITSAEAFKRICEIHIKWYKKNLTKKDLSEIGYDIK